jgi:hypothetical protein
MPRISRCDLIMAVPVMKFATPKLDHLSPELLQNGTFPRTIPCKPGHASSHLHFRLTPPCCSVRARRGQLPHDGCNAAAVSAAPPPQAPPWP